jgi:signal transduction histidine kinase
MKKKFWLNLPSSLTKDFVLIYRISIVLIFLTSVLFLKFSIDQEREKIEEKIFVTSEQIENLISYNIDYLKYQLHYATKQIKETTENNHVANGEKVAKILSSFVGNINNQVDIAITWNAFSWVDKKGDMSADGAVGVIKNPVNVSSRDYLITTSKIPEKLVFGKPLLGALSGRYIIPIGMGVFSNSGDYLGTLAFGLDIERIIDKILKTISNENLSFAVIEGSEIAFASDNFDEKRYEELADKISSLNELELTKVIDRQNLFNKDQSFAAVRIIKNSPLKILVLYDSNESYRQIFNLFLKQLLLVFLVIFACIVLFQKIYYQIVKPVSGLSKFASKISKQDFSFVPESPKSGELLDLFNTLNSVKEVTKREKDLLKKLEVTNHELFRANEAKAEFLAKSSHDIKNYIFGICGLSKIILGNKSRSEILQSEELQMVETIADQSEELMHFVEDLLDTNQVDTGEFSLEKFKPCDVSSLIDRIVLLNKSLATRHHTVVKTEIENNLPKLYCDIRRMKQILVNLVTNAIKYSKSQTSVTISAKYLKSEGQIYIEILDQGIGMSKQEVEILLQGRGRDIDKSGLENVDSHGIGMSIVFKLVEMHSGKIEIESVKNKGTKVRLFFNVYEVEDNEEILRDKKNKNSVKNQAVLLVEDNPANIKITSKVLRDLGYKTSYAENGLEALKFWMKKILI